MMKKKRYYALLVLYSICLPFHGTAFAAGCEFLNTVGHWQPTDKPDNQQDCNDVDGREKGGTPYTWQDQDPPDSWDGECHIDVGNNGKGTQYGTSKIGCENHDKHGDNTSYHWYSNNYPTVYVGNEHTGYSYEIKNSLPSLCHGAAELMRICHLIRSYHIPEGWQVEFFTEENYQGNVDTRSFHNQPDEDDYDGTNVNSIRVSLNGEEIPGPPYGGVNPPTQPPKNDIEHTINSVKQLFFGQRNPEIECGDDARLMTENDIGTIGKDNICAITSDWSIYKYRGNDGTKWAFMGKRYDCKTKPEVGAWAPPICVMQDMPPDYKAYLFASDHFKGKSAWGGKAEIRFAGDYNDNTEVKSFLLGDDVIVKGYSEPNFSGTETIYKGSAESVEMIRSYRVESK